MAWQVGGMDMLEPESSGQSLRAMAPWNLLHLGLKSALAAAACSG